MIELTHSTATPVLLLLLLLAAVVSFFYYRTTVPPVEPGKRLVLTFLRGLALFLLGLLLFEPLVSIIDRTDHAPIVAVLIDNSESMQITDRHGSRADLISEALRSLADLDVPSEGLPRFYAFGPGLSEGSDRVPDSLPFDQPVTNISAALSQLKREQENIQAAILLTDGLSNRGENPLYEAADLGFPVFAVGIGDSSQQIDIAVTKVLANEIVYENTPTPVDVTVRATGFSGRAIEVVLEQDGRPIARQSVSLGNGTRTYQVSLLYTPTGEGVRKFTVRLPSLEGELTTENNRAAFFSRIVKDKLHILLVSGGPSKDLSVIREVLTRDNPFTLTSRTERVGTGYYEGSLTKEVIDSADCIILLGFPVGTSSAEDIARVQNAAEADSKPVLFIYERGVSTARFGQISPVLPVVLTSISSAESFSFLIPVAAHSEHPVLRPEGKEISAWEELPPVFTSGSVFRPRAESVVLAQPRTDDVILGRPGIVTRSVAGRKSAALLAYGLWRWELMTAGDPAMEGFLSAFMSGIVRWLTTPDDDRPLKVQTTREFYAGGEPVEFTAQLYDESAQPVDNAVVTVTASGGEATVDARLESIGNGRYEGLLYGLNEGEYTYNAKAVVGQHLAGEAAGRFSVGELSLEFRDTRMDASLLRQLAYRTGGRFFTLPDNEAIEEILAHRESFAPLTTEHRSRLDLRTWLYTLLFAIFVLTAEWVIRKQSGLM